MTDGNAHPGRVAAVASSGAKLDLDGAGNLSMEHDSQALAELEAAKLKRKDKRRRLRANQKAKVRCKDSLYDLLSLLFTSSSPQTYGQLGCAFSSRP